jgi:hypothetical protein
MSHSSLSSLSSLSPFTLELLAPRLVEHITTIEALCELPSLVGRTTALNGYKLAMPPLQLTKALNGLSEAIKETNNNVDRSRMIKVWNVLRY